MNIELGGFYPWGNNLSVRQVLEMDSKRVEYQSFDFKTGDTEGIPQIMLISNFKKGISEKIPNSDANRMNTKKIVENVIRAEKERLLFNTTDCLIEEIERRGYTVTKN